VFTFIPDHCSESSRIGVRHRPGIAFTFPRNPHSVADDAHTLGAEYVVCSTVPHKKKLTAEDCERAIADLNRFGENLAKAGLRCCYHIHGVEFGKALDGTLFDTLAKGTNPNLVNFEMDIFWIVFAYQDPVKLLHQHPGRFPLMHVKDIRKGTTLEGHHSRRFAWRCAGGSQRSAWERLG
jgi:sugar phosphate isomerase/epimerase